MISDDESKEIVAENVNRLLRQQGHSRYWLAKETGEYQSRIGSICNAENCCSAATLARIAEALKVTVDELISRKRKKYGKVS